MKNLVKIKDTFFCSVRHYGKAMLLLVALTALSSTAWADDMNFFVDGAWDLQYYDGGDHWLSDGGGYKMGSTQELGVKSTLYIKGTWVKTWQNGTWVVNNVTFYYNVTDDSQHDYKINDYNDLGSGNRSWTIDNKIDYDLIGKAPNNPGQNTMAFHYVINEWGDRTSSTCYLNFTIPGFKKTTATGSFGDVNIGANKSETISFTQHYGTSLNTSNCKITGDGASSYSVTGISETGVTVKFQPTGGIGSKPATLTITDAHSKKCTITLSGNATSSTAPTVLISKSEQVNLQEVTLFGYVKYTGCKNINKVGFIISQNEEEVEDGTAQVYNATTAPDAPIAAMSDFSLFSDEFENNVTYYYRAWMKASDNTIALSDEVRTFEPQGVCNAISAGAILPIFKSGKTTESATFADEHASIDLSVDKNCIADVYQWNVESQPDGGNATFSTGNKRNTSVTVSAVGTYTFTLTAGCAEGTQFKSTTVLTLNVCEPAEFTQLYLDNHTDNVLCVGEKATATCITKEGYTYTLFSPSGGELGSLAGTGGTQTWRNVTGAGEFTMRTSPTSMPQCAAVVSSATQRYNEPTMEITAEPALSVLSYQPVTLSKKAGEAETYVDTDPTWVITDGSDKAYLLNEHNRLAYDNRARKSVVFKAGAGVATQITVAASAYKTVEVDDPDPKVENYTKQCPATVDVTLTVSPAVDDCPQP